MSIQDDENDRIWYKAPFESAHVNSQSHWGVTKFDLAMAAKVDGQRFKSNIIFPGTNNNGARGDELIDAERIIPWSLALAFAI